MTGCMVENLHKHDLGNTTPTHVKNWMAMLNHVKI